MTFLKNWTKKQTALGVGLAVVLVLAILVYTFISDYENAKENTLAQAEVDIQQLTAEQDNILRTLQTRLDEQLIQSDGDDVLTRDAQFRNEYQELQRIFLTMVTNGEGNGYTKEAKDALDAIGIDETSFVSIYVNEQDLSNGTVYYLGDTTHVFTFEYTDNVVTLLNYQGTVDTQAVQIEEE